MRGRNLAMAGAPDAGRGAITTRRRESILELLETAGQAVSAAAIADELLEKAGHGVGIERTSFLRNVQRDLVAMARLGKVEKAGDRWHAAERDADRVFDSLAGAVAIELLQRAAPWAVPEAILEQMGDLRSAASAKLRNAHLGHPVVRWLKALRVDEHPVYVLDRPVVDEDVRAAVEQAVLDSRRIRLWTATTGCVVGGRTMAPLDISISDYWLKLPDMAAIGYWGSDGKYQTLRLETVIRAEVLDEPAVRPLDPQPPGLKPAARRVERVEVEVMAAREVLQQRWKCKEIGRRLTVLETCANGAVRCSFEAELGDELVRFLAFYGGQVEVLRPAKLRDMVYECGLALLANYSSSNGLPRHQGEDARRRLDRNRGDSKRPVKPLRACATGRMGRPDTGRSASCLVG